MARALILDAEALHALARPSARSVLAARARAVLTLAHEHRAIVRVPAPVLAEVCRDETLDAAVGNFLSTSGSEVVDLDGPTARRAGRLLRGARRGSAHAIDAFVVAVAATYSWAVIATGDPDDLTRLASGFAHVHVVGI